MKRPHIRAIEETSEKVQEQMISILKKQQDISIEQLKKTQEISKLYLSLMQEQEQKSKERLESLNKEIVNNTQKGLSLLNQEVGSMSVNFDNKISHSFSQMDDLVNRLKKSIKYTDFRDKIKIAFPIALTSSILTLAFYFSITHFIK